MGKISFLSKHWRILLRALFGALRKLVGSILPWGSEKNQSKIGPVAAIAMQYEQALAYSGLPENSCQFVFGLYSLRVNLFERR
jgi:hypothetical protein